MLISAFVIWLFLGGASGSLLPKDFNKQLKSAIEVKDERKEIEAIAKDMDKVVKDYNESAKETIDQLVETNREYSSDPNELRAYVEALLTSRTNAQTQFIDLRMKMAEKMTREQWAVAFAEKK